MNTYLCGFLALGLLVLFSTVNLFLPYALLIIGAILGLGYACRTFSRSEKRECMFGMC